MCHTKPCFRATVTNLEGKVETLSTTNCLMKEDLTIARNSFLRTQEDNKVLLAQLKSMENGCRTLVPKPTAATQEQVWFFVFLLV